MVLKEDWNDFKGIIVSDGWKLFGTIFAKNKRHRCTVHLKRESKDAGK